MFGPTVCVKFFVPIGPFFQILQRISLRMSIRETLQNLMKSWATFLTFHLTATLNLTVLGLWPTEGQPFSWKAISTVSRVMDWCKGLLELKVISVDPRDQTQFFNFLIISRFMASIFLPSLIEMQCILVKCCLSPSLTLLSIIL